ncbi:MAG: hypothetical protein P9X22_09490 [Candidatus Zapsychrus exili]|nr:hypothetical protein [Candidatus Zapsychrus exili]
MIKIKKLVMLTFAFLFMFVFVYIKFASSENIKDVVKVEENKNTQQVKPISKNPFHLRIEEMLESSPEVSNKIEEIYDLNKDKILQKEEIKKFILDIHFTLQRRGWIAINSRILEVFDKNEDGRITQFESSDIKKYMR